MISLAPHTTAIFDKAIQLDCIKPYFLVGGTALSLQLGTRMSEDLDFMRWRTSKAERMEVAWKQIEQELATIGEVHWIEPLFRHSSILLYIFLLSISIYIYSVFQIVRKYIYSVF